MVMQENPQYANDALKELNDYRFKRDLQRYRLMRKKIGDVFRKTDDTAKKWLAGGICAAIITPYFFAPPETKYLPIAIIAGSFATALPILADFLLLSGDELTKLRTELSELEERLHNYQK